MHVTSVSRCVFLQHKYDVDAALDVDYTGLFHSRILCGGREGRREDGRYDEIKEDGSLLLRGKRENGNAEERLAGCGVRDIAGNFAFGSSDRYALMCLARLIKGKSSYRISLDLKSISAKETALYAHVRTQRTHARARARSFARTCTHTTPLQVIDSCYNKG